MKLLKRIINYWKPGNHWHWHLFDLGNWGVVSSEIEQLINAESCFWIHEIRFKEETSDQSVETAAVLKLALAMEIIVEQEKKRKPGAHTRFADVFILKSGEI